MTEVYLLKRKTERVPFEGYPQKLQRRYGGLDLATVRRDAVDWISKVNDHYNFAPLAVAPVPVGGKEEDGKRKPRVLVAGGGIGGLVFALAAWRKGYQVKVFERDLSTVRGEGQYRGPIQIQSNALAVLEAAEREREDRGVLAEQCKPTLPSPFANRGGSLSGSLLAVWSHASVFGWCVIDKDMDSIVETMMQQLLFKEILHEPMKDIVEKYPKWLEDDKGTISKEEYERYNKQLGLMVKLIVVYENDPENMTKIFDIMQNMQECGQPPSGLVQDIVPDLDLSKLAQIPRDQRGAREAA